MTQRVDNYYPMWKEGIEKEKQIELLDFEYIGMMWVLKGYEDVFVSDYLLSPKIFSEFDFICERIKKSEKFDQNLSDYMHEVYKKTI